MAYQALLPAPDSAAICEMPRHGRPHRSTTTVKAIKPLPKRKSEKNCAPGWTASTAPCKGGCPIEQDIPEYVELCRKEPVRPGPEAYH